jgi:hypothetical protein
LARTVGVRPARVGDRERPAGRDRHQRHRRHDELGRGADGGLRQQPRVPRVPAEAAGPGAPAEPGAARDPVERPAGQSGRHRDQRQLAQQSLRRNQLSLVAQAPGAVPDVPGQALAPQRARLAGPDGGDRRQTRALRCSLQRPHHRAGRVEPFLHPRDPDGRVGRRYAERAGQFGPAELPRGLLPPEGEHRPVLVVEPAGGRRRLQPLAGQAEPGDGLVREVGARHLRLHRRRLRQTVPVGVAHLPDRDRHQPGPERCRVAQLADAPDRAEHGLLDDVIDVRVTVHGPADDVVDQRQVSRGQGVERAPVAALRGDHRRDVRFSLRWCSHHNLGDTSGYPR